MRKTAQAAGLFCIAMGIGVNHFTLGYWSPDGHIRSFGFNLLIGCFEIASAGTGALLLRYPGKQSLINVLLAGCSFCAAFVFCEGAVRVRYFGWRGLSPRQMDSTAWLANLGYLQQSKWPDIGYELKANLDTTYDFARLHTNSAGMPDREYATERAPDVFRIAVLGDSFTMAAGVPPEDNYTKALEGCLEEKAFAGNKKIECLNFGVAGYQPHQYRAVLEHKALAFAPDMVLIGFCAENDDLFNDAKDETLLAPIGALPPFFQSYLVKLILLLNTPATHHAGRESSARDLQYVDSEFEKIAALCAPRHVPVVIAFLANVPRSTQNIVALARGHGFGFVDCSAGFDRRRLNENAIYLPFDMHPNARANQLFARAICHYLTASE